MRRFIGSILGFLLCCGMLIAQTNSYGRLRIYTDDKAEVYVDESFIGYGSQSIDVPVGNHLVSVRWRANGLQSKEQTVVVGQQGTNVDVYVLGELRIRNNEHFHLWDVQILLIPETTGAILSSPISVKDAVVHGLYGQYRIAVSKTGYETERSSLYFEAEAKNEYIIPELKVKTQTVTPPSRSTATTVTPRTSTPTTNSASTGQAATTATTPKAVAVTTGTKSKSETYTKEKKYFPSHTFIEYQYSPKANCGVMLGWCKRAGVYASFRTNVALKKEAGESHLYIKGDNVDFPFGYQGYSATGGLMLGLAQWLYLYAGVGYGVQQCNGSQNLFASVMNSKGLAADAGIIIRFSVFNISVGYNTLCNTEYNLNPLGNINAGIGFNL